MDTPLDDRVKNPLRPIYDIQDEFSRQNRIPDSPLYVDVEPTNYCNFTCKFCVRQQMKRPRGYMSIDKFQIVAESARAANAKAIRFAGWGEPFLNKDIYKMIKIVNFSGMVSHVTTNGTLIDIDKVLDSGLKSIYFSMQGLNNDEYAKLRNTDKFPLLERKIQELMYERKKRALDYPFVQVNTSITDETKEEQQVFLTKWKQIVDDVSISYTWLKRLEDKSLVKEWVDRSPELPHLFQCNEVRSKLAVHWDGTVTPCCEDYDEAFNLGNAFNNSLQEIWDSPLATGIRLILSVHGKQDLFSLCEKCELCHDFRGNLK